MLVVYMFLGSYPDSAKRRNRNTPGQEPVDTRILPLSEGHHYRNSKDDIVSLALHRTHSFQAMKQLANEWQVIETEATQAGLFESR